jgi:hypothetical protein
LGLGRNSEITPSRSFCLNTRQSSSRLREKARAGGPGGLIRGSLSPPRSIVSGLGSLVTEAGELDEAGDDGGGEHGLDVHQLLWGETPSETDMGYPTSDTKVQRAQSEVPTKKPRAAWPAGLKKARVDDGA